MKNYVCQCLFVCGGWKNTETDNGKRGVCCGISVQMGHENGI